MYVWAYSSRVISVGTGAVRIVHLRPGIQRREKVDSFWFVPFDPIHHTLFIVLTKSAQVQSKVKLERAKERARGKERLMSTLLPKGARTLVKTFAPAAAYAHLPLTRSEALLRILPLQTW